MSALSHSVSCVSLGTGFMVQAVGGGVCLHQSHLSVAHSDTFYLGWHRSSSLDTPPPHIQWVHCLTTQWRCCGQTQYCRESRVRGVIWGLLALHSAGFLWRSVGGFLYFPLHCLLIRYASLSWPIAGLFPFRLSLQHHSFVFVGACLQPALC